MDSDHHSSHDGMQGDTAADWDRRYGETAQLFSGNVNASLVALTGHLGAGTALDLACGEGADAIWLAEAGWDVTATDISPVAIERADRAADDAGRDVTWVVHDLADGRPTAETFDLVTTHYPAFPKRTADRSIPALLDSVAGGGTLLFVTHDFEHHDHHPSFDPADYVLTDDVVVALDDTWTIGVHETRPRTPPPGHDGPAVPDRILRARRTA